MIASKHEIFQPYAWGKKLPQRPKTFNFKVYIFFSKVDFLWPVFSVRNFGIQKYGEMIKNVLVTQCIIYGAYIDNLEASSQSLFMKNRCFQ